MSYTRPWTDDYNKPFTGWIGLARVINKQAAAHKRCILLKAFVWYMWTFLHVNNSCIFTRTQKPTQFFKPENVNFEKEELQEANKTSFCFYLPRSPMFTNNHNNWLHERSVYSTAFYYIAILFWKKSVAVTLRPSVKERLCHNLCSDKIAEEKHIQLY